jgi:hypothetical protein
MRSCRPVLGEHSGSRGGRRPTGLGPHVIPISPEKPELSLEIAVESAELVVAAATSLVVVQYEVPAWFGDDRAESYLKGLMTDETFGHNVLDGFLLGRRAAEHAGRHATNLIGGGNSSEPLGFDHQQLSGGERDDR